MPKQHGGKRKGAGRKPRPTTKSKSIWCGQISESDRKFIMDNLLPNERYQILMQAANNRLHLTECPVRILGDACPVCGGTEWQCAECNGALGR